MIGASFACANRVTEERGVRSARKAAALNRARMALPAWIEITLTNACAQLDLTDSPALVTSMSVPINRARTTESAKTWREVTSAIVSLVTWGRTARLGSISVECLRLLVGPRPSAPAPLGKLVNAPVSAFNLCPI